MISSGLLSAKLGYSLYVCRRSGVCGYPCVFFHFFHLSGFPFLGVCLLILLSMHQCTYELIDSIRVSLLQEHLHP